MNGTDDKKLSKRHGAVTVKEFRDDGYVAPALMNFLALLGWAPDGETTIMSREELVRRFDLAPRAAEPGRVRLREARLDERRLPARDVSRGVRGRAGSCTCASRATSWDEQLIRRAAPLVQRSSRASPRVRALPASCSRGPSRRRPRTAQSSQRRPRLWPRSSRSTPSSIEAALRGLAERLGLKPREAFQPIRLALTGSKVSPGLFESLELLGKEESLARIGGSGRGGPSGSSAR